MKTSALKSLILALPALASASTKCKPLVDSESLQELITLDDLLENSQVLQDIADANGGHRVFGSGGHNATVDFLYDSLKATGYYNVVKQPFTELYAEGSGSLSVDGAKVDTSLLTYSPGGSYNGPLVLGKGLGCKAGDYPAETRDAVVMVQRGECPFGQKSALAAAAGAKGVIVYNSEPGKVSGTLGEPFGNYAPCLGVSLEDGKAIIAALGKGEVSVDFQIDAIIENRVNYNVIAETKTGDHDNVLILGGHTDSVRAGPGINDDGSGTIGVLNVALALPNFRINNAVRFAFWGAEEFGKLGSYHYVKQLNSSQTELTKMRAYLNFDMIASPNYVYGIYDGDGSAFNLTGPAGSDVIEEDFEQFYETNGHHHVPSAFSGRSDYAAFIENGIPSGGLFTGAESLKTEAEAAMFGGEAGVSYDIHYHKAGDDINNLAHDAYLVNSKSIANSVAKYALSFDSLPSVELGKRGWTASNSNKVKRDLHSHESHGGPCGGGPAI